MDHNFNFYYMYSGYRLIGSLANSDDPDEMLLKAAFLSSISSGSTQFAKKNKNNLQGQKYIILKKF